MATISPQQILIPKKVYIGDTAELRCTFNSPDPFLKQLTSSGTAELPLVSQSIEPQEEYVIKNISLSPSGIDFYQLTITFIPWKTGDLLFPSMEIEGSDIVLEFQPIQIVSLIANENTNTSTIRDTAAPLLLPGTTYKLYGTLSVFVIFLLICIRIILKRKNILFYINQKRLLKKYKKNKKQTIRNLYKIADEAEAAKIDDQTAAENLQKSLRTYLEIRFDYPFTHTVASEIMQGWQTATGGLLSDTKTEAFGNIAASFIRTDFIRYSKNGKFEENELINLIEKIISQIQILEQNEESLSGSNSDNIPIGG
ncbi:MAG: hypothetical protein SPK18_02515 [Treponema sp.]|nr:hypothetical protein [Treponema sp.]MDY5757444.1 hypothetical protein [Treponema sp.]